MAAAFHHGSETIRVNGGSVPVSQVDGAIIGIIGTAPQGAVNALTVCVTKKDFAQFGEVGQGYTIPDALEILGRYASGQVYVVNVFDPEKHSSPDDVTIDDIKGGVDTATGKRTGFELMRAGFTLFGSDAKILLCPKYDEQVASSLSALAEQLNAVAYIQAPSGTTLAGAITGRGSEGTINFNTSNERTHLFFPHAVGESGELENLAVHAAGLRMKTDVEQGYWFSTSNRELLGVVGMEVPLTARIDDVQSETNRLNAVGITTIFNSFGTGFRLWGNRLASYPTTTHISNFEVVQRTADLIDESIRRVELQFIDRPIDQPLLDSLLGTVETYMGTLKSIVGYEIMLDPDADLVDAFSQGNVPIQYSFTPKIPAERITNTSIVTRKYLVNLVSGGK